MGCSSVSCSRAISGLTSHIQCSICYRQRGDRWWFKKCRGWNVKHYCKREKNTRGHTEPTYVVHVCVLNELKGTRSIVDNHLVTRTVILVVATSLVNRLLKIVVYSFLCWTLNQDSICYSISGMFAVRARGWL